MSSNNDLSALNSQTLGANFPEIILPDGSIVQTGTVGALLANIKTYNQLTASISNVPATRPGDRTAIRSQIAGLDDSFRAAMPLLYKVGLFQLFTPDEWTMEGQGGSSPGRKRVGELAKVWLAENGKGN